MDSIQLVVTISFNGPLESHEVLEVVDTLEAIIAKAIEHNKLDTGYAEASDYEFDYEAK